MNANDHTQELWNREDPALPKRLDSGEICMLARRRERESVLTRMLALFALGGLALAFGHNAWEVDQPWVRLGQGWMLIVMTVYLYNLIRDRTSRRALDETCAGFLLRSLRMKREGLLALRRVVLFTIPAMLASWWGGGPALKARAMGLDPASTYYRYLNSVWPMVATSVLLVLVWLLFTAAARKASAEFEALRRRVVNLEPAS